MGCRMSEEDTSLVDEWLCTGYTTDNKVTK